MVVDFRVKEKKRTMNIIISNRHTQYNFICVLCTIVFVLIGLSTPVSAMDRVPHEWVVMMDESQTPANGNAILEWHKGILDVVPVKLPSPKSNKVTIAGFSESVFRIKLSPTENEDAVRAAIEKQPGVRVVQPNNIFKVASDDDPNISSEWYYDTLGMDSAYKINDGNPNVVIAIVDTGVDYRHEDLVGKIWRNYGEIPHDGIDNDHNGYIDDVQGWDFVSVSPIKSTSTGKSDDYAPQDNDPNDGQGHGTFVAGIIAMEGKNGKGGRGVGGNCRIMPVRAGYADEIGDGAFTSTDLAQGITYAAANGANIINLSLGAFGEDALLEAAIKTAVDSGAIVVAAAGNSRSDINGANPFIPATYPGVIAVSGLNENSEFDWSYSDFGKSITIAAPGTHIFSTKIGSSHSEYGSETGTSMAAPMVAGIAGLILSVNPSADVKTILKKSARPKSNRVQDEFYGAGVLDAVRALQLADSSTPNIQHSIPVDANWGYPITLNATVTDPNTSSNLLAVRLYYRFSVSDDWKSVSANYSSGKFYASTPVASRPNSALQYYFTAANFNPSSNVRLPSNAPTTFFEIPLVDSRGPEISTSQLDGDWVDVNKSVTLNLTDVTGIDFASVRVRVSDAEKTVTYSATSPELTRESNTLLLSLKSGKFSSAVTISVSVSDTLGNSSSKQFKLKPAGSGSAIPPTGLLGPDASDALLAYPNPYNPNNGNVQFAYHIDRDSEITVHIYSRTLERVKTITESKLVGYNTTLWDGKDDRNVTVPNGVYFVIIRADSSDGTSVRRLKLAVKTK